ncbi:hypothetical protein [Hyphobacterium marinum]|uniref:Uncharacterized protein n=1 Tax=Hyphobacterium marinum TaxID=3116574 RepID=A0ABU7LY24_9PROT|nr:hypothetical protein [Hyphobacterium sp. Y6023]MEE2566452.1 hypothetical protein [Hyphobacterium sp. Y6023]
MIERLGEQGVQRLGEEFRSVLFGLLNVVREFFGRIRSRNVMKRQDRTIRFTVTGKIGSKSRIVETPAPVDENLNRGMISLVGNVVEIDVPGPCSRQFQQAAQDVGIAAAGRDALLKERIEIRIRAVPLITKGVDRLGQPPRAFIDRNFGEHARINTRRLIPSPRSRQSVRRQGRSPVRHRLCCVFPASGQESHGRKDERQAKMQEHGGSRRTQLIEPRNLTLQRKLAQYQEARKASMASTVRSPASP